MIGALEYAAGEELQPRQRLQIQVSENFMILCYSNSVLIELSIADTVSQEH